MSTYQVGDKVSKINTSKVGSARVYEIATVTPMDELAPNVQRAYADRATDGVIYTLRKVGGRGKGGCWYPTAQLAPAQD